MCTLSKHEAVISLLSVVADQEQSGWQLSSLGSDYLLAAKLNKASTTTVLCKHWVVSTAHTNSSGALEVIVGLLY